MDQPAQTFGYMVAGYVVIFGALFGYLLSLIIRWRALLQKKQKLAEK
jgi:hypothetical protein